ncbi:hypothetical protein INR49_020374 [Caranx melampygus]|nr:hypothetical protein INR49_020374 [Caranx melampygus]
MLSRAPVSPVQRLDVGTGRGGACGSVSSGFTDRAASLRSALHHIASHRTTLLSASCLLRAPTPRTPSPAIIRGEPALTHRPIIDPRDRTADQDDEE